MTWKEFKERVELSGVVDSDEFYFLELPLKQARTMGGKSGIFPFDIQKTDIEGQFDFVPINK